MSKTPDSIFSEFFGDLNPKKETINVELTQAFDIYEQIAELILRDIKHQKEIAFQLYAENVKAYGVRAKHEAMMTKCIERLVHGWYDYMKEEDTEIGRLLRCV